MRSTFFWSTTKCKVVIPYRRFGTTYRLDFSTPEFEPICCPESSVRNYHRTLRNIPEERSALISTFTFRLMKETVSRGSCRNSARAENPVLLADTSMEMCAGATTSDYFCHHNETMDSLEQVDEFHAKQICLPHPWA